MNDSIRYVKDIQIVKEDAEPDLMAIKAKGIAELKKLISPVLVPKDYKEIPDDGIYELDFRLDENDEEFTNVELEVDVVFRIKNLPAWVKGVKINAAENSDIELLNEALLGAAGSPSA
jgi:hypothetical protein